MALDASWIGRELLPGPTRSARSRALGSARGSSPPARNIPRLPRARSPRREAGSRAGRWDQRRLIGCQASEPFPLGRRVIPIRAWTSPNPGMGDILKVTCGIGRAEKHHDIALVDENGVLV